MNVRKFDPNTLGRFYESILLSVSAEAQQAVMRMEAVADADRLYSREVDDTLRAKYGLS